MLHALRLFVFGSLYFAWSAVDAAIRLPHYISSVILAVLGHVSGITSIEKEQKLVLLYGNEQSQWPETAGPKIKDSIN